MKKYLLFFALFAGLFLTGYSQTCDPNMDLETGTFSGWKLYEAPSGALATYSVAATPSPNFTITSGSGMDSYGSFPVVGTGSHSIQIGTDYHMNQQRKATFVVHVPATGSYSLIYKIAMVIKDSGSSLSSPPRINVQAFDITNAMDPINGGLNLPCMNFSFASSSSPGFMSSATPYVKYLPWKTILLNLNGHNGDSIRLEFSPAEGAYPTCFSYAYIDMSCGLFEVTKTATCGSPSVTLTAPSGFANYRWYNAGFTTLLGTTGTITVPAPATPTSYAVILAPAGYGCTDTLYTTVSPDCSGTPSPGTIAANITTACPSNTVTLTNTGYTGSDLQWQSSPDSLTWTNIPGATSATYAATGITATTYFRTRDSCCASGLTAASPGIKINYLPCCSGMPTAGTASASTAYCSACTLTLDLTGYSTLPGTSYQWQVSADSAIWTDISGATTISYTFSPPGSYYYRCKVNCSFSGLTAYSNEFKVLYQYLIVTDTVSTTPGTTCPGPGPEFYVKVNGTSGLLALKTYYGDGTSDSLAFTPATGYSYSAHNHIYGVSGSYTIKHVVYWNNIPQDSTIYSYVYHHCNMLHVNLYLDSNANCTLDFGEYWLTLPACSIEIDSNGVALDTQSVTMGLNYNAYGAPGTVYTFRLLTPSYYVVCPVSGVLTYTITTSSSYPTQSFAMGCPAGTFDLAEHSTFSCASINKLRGDLMIANNLCTPTYATITLNHSPRYTYFSATPAPAAVTGTTVTWNQLLSATTVYGAPAIHYLLQPAAGATIVLGDTIHSNISITPSFGDLDVTNNSELVIDTVTGPFDPNFIDVLPSGCFESDTEFRYTIHFENMGNDTAHNVHVMDTLSNFLDMGSLKIVAASAWMEVTRYTDGPYHIVKFDFPNIKLLDSSKHGLNDGAVIYTINTKTGLANGSSIANRAGIYFDYNEVVMTNTVENTKGCPALGVTAANRGYKTEIYPNPATTLLTVKMEDNSYSSFTITNNIGQELMHQALTTTLSTINIGNLPAGLYYITLRGDNGTLVRKFVKM